MKSQTGKNTKRITDEVKSLSLENQILISNNIISNVNKIVDRKISESLSAFKAMIGGLGELKDKQVLILQPEKYMTQAIFLCLNGASIVYGLNRFVDSEQRLSTYYDKLLDFILANKSEIIVQREMSEQEIIDCYRDLVSNDKKKMSSYLNRDRVRFSLGEDSSMMPYQNDQFDVVILDNVMETLYYPFQSINEIRRVMTKNGLLYMRVNPYGIDTATGSALGARLKQPRVLYEKSFSYKSADYCNRLVKADLLFHLENFNFKIDNISQLSKLKFAPYDKKSISAEFMLFGEEELSVTSFVLTATKRERRNDHFSKEDYATYAKSLDLYYKGKYNAASARFDSLRKHPLDSGLEESKGLLRPPLDDRVTRGLFHTLYALEDYEAAAQAYSEIKKSDMKQSVMDYYYIGMSHYNLDKISKAKRYFIKAKELNEKQHMLYNAIGLCYCKDGDDKEGLKYLRHSVKLFPYYSDGLNSIGTVLEKMDERKAIDHFKMVLTIDPGHNEALFSLGRLLYNRGWYDESSKFLKDYCMIDGTNEAAVKMHIDCLIKLGLKRSAKKEIEDMLEKDPTNAFISDMFDDFVENVAL